MVAGCELLYIRRATIYNKSGLLGIPPPLGPVASKRTAHSLSREAHEMRVDLLLAGDLVALALLSSFLVHLLQLFLLCFAINKIGKR